MENIHKNIGFLRQKRGWTQKELAEKLGIKKSMIGAYEEYRSVPILTVTKRIAALFDVSLDDLVNKDLTKIKITA